LNQDAKFNYGSLWERLSTSLKDVLRWIAPSRSSGRLPRSVRSRSDEAGDTEIEKWSICFIHRPRAEGFPREPSCVRALDRRLHRPHQHAKAGSCKLARTLAPNALRVNWLWTVQAQLGDPSHLIAGLTRDWILQRWRGVSLSLFDILITDAVAAALDRAEFARPIACSTDGPNG